MNKRILGLAVALAMAGTAQATVITPVNMDGAGTGLNDPTLAAPVGGNPGTTIGAQRQYAYQFAADLWEAVLESAVEIKVEASFAALSCTASSGTLGSAGAKTVHREFPNAVPGTWYGAALANARAGFDLDPSTNDITSRFNANLGTPGCLENSGWYYGVDGNTPAGKINFLNVVMHEIGHGLNFQSFYSVSTGAPFSGYPDIYALYVRDNNSNTDWTAMDNAQRAAAAIGNNLVWTGPTVTTEAPFLLGDQVNLFLQLPNRPNDFAMVTAGYGPVATTVNFTSSPLVRARDTSGSSLGCAAFTPGSLAGKSVLIDRGSCSFKLKTLNAQNAGASKVVIANNVTSGFPGMGDDVTITDPITIPSIGITLTAGNTLKKSIIFQPNVNLQVKPGQYAGTDGSGRVRLYAPNPVAVGSTLSHFDTTLAPNALMEPFITSSLNAAVELDLTPALFKDLGWTLKP
jgi:hypothetical protein